MARYAWKGRMRNGAAVQGEIEAPTREAAIEQVEAGGVVGVSVSESGGSEDRPGASRKAGSWRDGAFPFMVALASAAVSVGVGFVDPVLTYDCQRDVAGAVGCHISRKAFGLVPLAPVDANRVLSASTRVTEQSRTMAERNQDLRRGTRPQESENLLLICASGPCWTSRSSWPMGESNSEIAAGINGLLTSPQPGEFHAHQAEKVTLAVAAAFLVPGGFILLGLVLRLMFGWYLTPDRVRKLSAEIRSRRGR
jgi:hypothetical protein